MARVKAEGGEGVTFPQVRRGLTPPNGADFAYNEGVASTANEATRDRRKTVPGLRPHPAKEL